MGVGAGVAAGTIAAEAGTAAAAAAAAEAGAAGGAALLAGEGAALAGTAGTASALSAIPAAAGGIFGTGVSASTVLTGASLLGTGVSALGQMQAANAARAAGLSGQAAANYEAQIMQQKANTEAGLAQRNAENENRRTRIIQSNLQASAAASGGSATDPTTMDLAGDISQEGQYRALSSLASGELASQDLNTSAVLRRYGGAQSYAAGQVRGGSYDTGAVGTLLSGTANSLYRKYGGGGNAYGYG